MRSFLAIKLNQDLKNELRALQDGLKQREALTFKWVRPELLHITLKFLGEITPEHISLLEKPLQELANSTDPFHLSLAGLGVFPHKSRPRLLWVGIKEGAVEIIKLSKAMEKIVNQLALFPYRQPKKIIPHITIGRQKKPSRSLPPTLFQRKWECKKILFVDRFFLIKSTLQPSGPIYSPLREFLLK